MPNPPPFQIYTSGWDMLLIFSFYLGCQSSPEYETCTLNDSNLSFDIDELLCIMWICTGVPLANCANKTFWWRWFRTITGGYWHIMTMYEPLRSIYIPSCQCSSGFIVYIGHWYSKKRICWFCIKKVRGKALSKDKSDKYIEANLSMDMKR